MQDENSLIRPIKWRRLEEDLELRRVGGRYWLGLPDGKLQKRERYVIREADPMVIQTVSELLGPIEIGQDFDGLAPESWERIPDVSEISQRAKWFTNSFGLLWNFNSQEWSEKNPRGVIYDGSWVGIVELQEWADFIFELRSAVRMLKLARASVGPNSGERDRAIQRELQKRIQVSRDSNGEVELIRYIYERPILGADQSSAWVDDFWEYRELYRRFGRIDRPELLLAAIDHNFPALALIVCAGLVEEKLKTGLSMVFPLESLRGSLPSFRPQIVANSAAKELWLCLSEALARLDHTAVCPNPKCGKLFLRSRGGRGRTSQRCCSKECTNAFDYQRRKQRASGSEKEREDA